MTETPRTVKEAAALIGISERSLWEVIRRGEIAVLRYGSARGRGARNITRLELAAIESYKARHRQPAATS